ncbi:eukaryotic translation initiation factor 4E [Perkinsela sp. CCAP 1560/4]|nr:eukaryotic translation initiation factor 4E [Perkinsela sp. CCAP 1560/4]|eukprot:KNH09652.1 eukaryotic translation initiation factor 4E [Perkinsela sp. CCAP 1560/4]
MAKQECVNPDIRLKHAYALWYSPQPTNEERSEHGIYDAQDKIASCLNKTAPIDTIKKFWANYLALPKPSTIPFFHKISLMRSDMKPLWSEPALQQSGGVITFTLDRTFADDVLDFVLMAIIGGTLCVFEKTPAEAGNPNESCVTPKPNVLVGCSIMRRRKRDRFQVQKDWIDCHIYLKDTTDDVRLYQALMDDIEEHVPGFKMGEAKHYRFAASE